MEWIGRNQTTRVQGWVLANWRWMAKYWVWLLFRLLLSYLLVSFGSLGNASGWRTFVKCAVVKKRGVRNIATWSAGLQVVMTESK